MKNSFALNHDKSLQIYFFRVKSQSKTNFLKSYQSTALRKHAFSNILRILTLKNENFQMKNSGSFQISAQNIDCGY